MTTITAKELRDNLSATLKRVSNGEEIEIIYRSRPIGKLVPKKLKAKDYSGAAIAQTLKALQPAFSKHKSKFDPKKSVKELYDETLRSDPKYAKYFKTPKNDTEK